MKQCLNVGIDLDGCGYPFVDTMRYLAVNYGSHNEADLGEPIGYTFASEWGMTREQFVDLMSKGIERGLLYVLGQPVPGFRAAMRNIQDRGDRAVIVTSRAIHTPDLAELIDKQTRAWLYWHDIPYDDIVFSPDKSKEAIDIAIDDEPGYCAAWMAAGVPCAIMDRSYNREFALCYRVHSWEEFVEWSRNGASDTAEASDWDPSEPEEIIAIFADMLRSATGDGAKKRQAGEKESWRVDQTHEPAIFSHINRWKHGEKVDPDSGAHPLVHLAWRALAVAWQETNAPSESHA